MSYNSYISMGQTINGWMESMNTTQHNTPTLTWGWLGGFFDSNGHVGFGYGIHQHKYEFCTLYVSITITDLDTITLIHKFTNTGTVHKAGGKRTPNQRQAYRWYISGKKAGAFLTLLQPFVVLKAYDVELGIEAHTLPLRDRLIVRELLLESRKR
jgi:hypothetical protein